MPVVGKRFSGKQAPKGKTKSPLEKRMEETRVLVRKRVEENIEFTRRHYDVLRAAKKLEEARKILGLHAEEEALEQLEGIMKKIFEQVNKKGISGKEALRLAEKIAAELGAEEFLEELNAKLHGLGWGREPITEKELLYYVLRGRI